MRAAGDCDYRKLREAYEQFIVERIQPDTFVTLATNKTYSIDQTRHALKDFLSRMDRALLGTQWAKQSMNIRTDGIIFIEHVASNTHAHCILRLPAQHPGDNRDVKTLIEQFWSKLVPAGNVDVQAIHNALGCADYCTKEMKFGHFHGDQIIFPSDFANRQN